MQRGLRRGQVLQSRVLRLLHERAGVGIGDAGGLRRAGTDRRQRDHVGLGDLGGRDRGCAAELAADDLHDRLAGRELQVGLHIGGRHLLRRGAQGDALPGRLHQQLRGGRVLLGLGERKGQADAQPQHASAITHHFRRRSTMRYVRRVAPLPGSAIRYIPPGYDTSGLWAEPRATLHVATVSVLLLTLSDCSCRNCRGDATGRYGRTKCRK